MLRTEDRGGYGEADCRRLARIGDRLVALLSGPQDRGVAVVPGTLPVLIPVFGTEPQAEQADPVVRGVPGVPGSTGMTLLYALQRLTRDSETDPPVPTAHLLTDEGSARAEHGRGLCLVDALAHTWNTSPSGWGKTIWLEMDIPQAHVPRGSSAARRGRTVN
ncbi:hypothetical protein [Streptomyces sp. NPDC001292]|uniref:hypothetical protein n=1 Tax=Streptomyces sp. NPDC001292 TaxID=3364558 RepID=UPI0036745B26